jgi:hypothetical protein
MPQQAHEMFSLIRDSRCFNPNVAHHCPVLPCDTFRPEVLGARPAQSPAQLSEVGFVAQDSPTYSGLRVADHLHFGAWMNPGWDSRLAERRVRQLGLALHQKAGRLSGGQRAQLALTVAIAKRPRLRAKCPGGSWLPDTDIEFDGLPSCYAPRQTAAHVPGLRLPVDHGVRGDHCPTSATADASLSRLPCKAASAAHAQRVGQME